MTNSPLSSSEVAGLLHRDVQRWLWRKQWTALRQVQCTAIPVIASTPADVVISAGTAAGKTEAAFLPILSDLCDDPPTGGVSVLCISPLKALINDQHDRLDDMCRDLEVGVTKWHGDAPDGAKQALLRRPEGILLITPESLEAMFVLRGGRVPGLLQGLRFVVVDELHAFIGTERGAQLQSLLHRVDLAVGRTTRRLGLSATLADLDHAAEFLRPGGGPAVRTVTDSSAPAPIRLQVRGHIRSAERDGGSSVDADIAAHLFEQLRAHHGLVFANTRHDVEVLCDHLVRLADTHRVPNPFAPHHGSLHRALREAVEARLKEDTTPATAVCTSTLELGIDIGAVDKVAQIDPPPTVAALRQRIGRAGRRGQVPEVRIYVREQAPDDDLDVAASLHPALIQTIAMVELLGERWLEPPDDRNLHLSTLVQQVMSLIVQHGGVTGADAYVALCGEGPFRRVDRALFVSFLRGLGASKLITQAGDGVLLLGDEGERLVNHYTFYPAFSTPEEYRIVHHGRTLGAAPLDPLSLHPGAPLLFAARRWVMSVIDERSRVVEVETAPAGTPFKVIGHGSAVVTHEVRARMREVYLRDRTPAFIDATATELVGDARRSFTRLGLAERSVVPGSDATWLFPWAGDRTTATIRLAFRAAGIDAVDHGVAVSVSLPVGEVGAMLDSLLDGGPPDDVELAGVVDAAKDEEKYDQYLPDDVLDVGFAARRLDCAAAWRALAALRGEVASLER